MGNAGYRTQGSVHSLQGSHHSFSECGAVECGQFGAAADQMWEISSGVVECEQASHLERLWARAITGGAVECGQFTAAACRASVGIHWWCCGMWAILDRTWAISGGAVECGQFGLL